MAYRSPPDNCEYPHFGYDCTPIKSAFNYPYAHQQSSPAPRSTRAQHSQQSQLTSGIYPPPSGEQPYQYGSNRHKRQRISPSETAGVTRNNDVNDSDREDSKDPNELVAYNIALLLEAARATRGDYSPDQTYESRNIAPTLDESRNFTRASHTQNQMAPEFSPLTPEEVPRLVKSRSSEPSISSSPGPLTPYSQNEIPYDQLYCPEKAPVFDLHHEVNQEQRRLFTDIRVFQQIERFKKAELSQSNTYYGAFAPIGLQILQSGRPAQTSDVVVNADFIVGDSNILEKWLLNGTGNKLFLLRDSDWLQTRPEAYGSTILDELRTTAINKKEMLIEVQHLGKKMGKNSDNHSVESMPIDQVIERFAENSDAPINLLSLMCRADGTVPWPLAKHCNLLNQAAASAASLAQSSFYATASKQATEVITKVIDLQSCMHFMIFGQAGAISSWHMDSIGPYTYISLEPNVKGKPAEDVLKLWAYVRTDHLSPKEQSEIKERFKKTGLAYQPDPNHIRVLALTAGDTLIMPPGTIHAPITITDCLFRGGMVMQKKEMRRSIREWRFCAENDICTNEDQPKQARSILDYFRRQVRADPASCGYLGPNGLDEYERDCIAIGGNSMSCRCASACKKGRCGCANNTQRCGAKCHKGVSKCDNPYGCEADVL